MTASPDTAARRGRVLEYPWPLIPESSDRPVWTGHGFRVGAKHLGVLSYEAGQSNWTDELTTFHEDTAGSGHPIDRASRVFDARDAARETARNANLACHLREEIEIQKESGLRAIEVDEVQLLRALGNELTRPGGDRLFGAIAEASSANIDRRNDHHGRRLASAGERG